jgi:curved DNA-binding protein CbpA
VGIVSGSERTLYQTMGVSPAAPSSEIREAYLRLARTLHPDRYADGSPGERRLAERRMREVNAAWAVLGRPESRRSYDAELSLTSQRAGRPRTSSPAPPSRTPSTARPSPERPSTPEDQDDDVELSPLAAFLLRRGPIIIVLFLALGLFVGTALADRRPRDPARSPTPTLLCATPSACTGGG